MSAKTKQNNKTAPLILNQQIYDRTQESVLKATEVPSDDQPDLRTWSKTLYHLSFIKYKYQLLSLKGVFQEWL